MDLLPLKSQRETYRENVLHVTRLRGMTAADLASAAGIDPRTIVRLIDADPVSAGTRALVAKTLGVSDRSLRLENPEYFNRREPGLSYIKNSRHAENEATENPSLTVEKKCAERRNAHVPNPKLAATLEPRRRPGLITRLIQRLAA